MKNPPIFSLIAGLGLAACGADFDPGLRVTSFRVLAVQADLPFARPGETVTLTSLSYDPQGRTVNWAWATCVNPVASTVEGCFAKIAADNEASGASPIAAQGPGLDTFTYTVPADALDSLPAAARASAFVGVINVACPGTLTLEAGAGDLPFHADSGRVLGLDEYVVGMKRIFVRSADRNQNPRIARVTFDGADWADGDVRQVAPCDTDGNTYSGCSGLADIESARTSRTGVSRRARTNSGSASRNRWSSSITPPRASSRARTASLRIRKTGWAARRKAAGMDLMLWFVVHDHRGGVTWTRRQADAQ